MQTAFLIYGWSLCCISQRLLLELLDGCFVSFQSATLRNVEFWNSSVATVASVVLPESSICELDLDQICIGFGNNVAVLIPQPGLIAFVVSLDRIRIDVTCVRSRWLVKIIEEQRAKLESANLFPTDVSESDL